MHPARRTDIFGVDFAWAQPNPWELRRHGVRFAVTYLSRDTTKGVSRDYMRRLSRAGIANVLVFEDAAARYSSGVEGGKADGLFISRRCRELGVPRGRPVYVAVDVDWRFGGVLDDYFRGLRGSRTEWPFGVYGGLRPVRYLLDQRVVSFAWQTYAWSGGQWDHRAQLRQYSNGHQLAGADVDYNRAVWSDFGQFHVR